MIVCADVPYKAEVSEGSSPGRVGGAYWTGPCFSPPTAPSSEAPSGLCGALQQLPSRVWGVTEAAAPPAGNGGDFASPSWPQVDNTMALNSEKRELASFEFLGFFNFFSTFFIYFWERER